MMKTKPDCYCTWADLGDLSTLPFGWCLIRREPIHTEDVESFGIKYLGDIDPMEKIAQLEAELEKANKEADKLFVVIIDRNKKIKELEAELADWHDRRDEKFQDYEDCIAERDALIELQKEIEPYAMRLDPEVVMNRSTPSLPHLAEWVERFLTIMRGR